MSEKAKTDDLRAMRHSLAHIMAAAIQKIWPDAKFGVGPVIENGFYYDVDLGKTIGPEVLEQIEKEMAKIIKANLPFEKVEMPIDDAIAWAKRHKQPYKTELLEDLKKHGTTSVKDIENSGLVDEKADKVTNVSFYKTGTFEDLCAGPHVESTAKVGAFKLEKLAGAYWRGDEKNAMLTRIYGVAFATKKELDDYFKNQELAKERDHRVLGERLELFMLSPTVGAGLPMLLPKGEELKHTLMEYMRTKEQQLGYQYVSTPVLAHEELYKLSGHAEFYKNDMYSFVDDEGNRFYLKPMNCPHHHQIYKRMVQSYKDLPLKLAEATGLYRRELSGVLTGLIRVRGPITQNDAHIYVTREQLEDEFKAVLDLFKAVYAEVGIKDYWFRLSLPDFSKQKFSGDRGQWEYAAAAIRQVFDQEKIHYVEGAGEAAFYGPKIDVQVRNVLGKEDSIATIQVDILQPVRSGLTYVDDQGKEQVPLVIHRAIIGSYERFMAFLIEQTGGNFPVWLAPEQVRVIALNDQPKIVDYAKQAVSKMKEAGLRVELDDSNETVGKKVRAAEVMKVPYTIVIGDKEVASGKVIPRVRSDIAVKHEADGIELTEFIKTVVNEAKSHVIESSL